MSERIKFIWDFYGPTGKPTAEHHIKHLGEFADAKDLPETIFGVENVAPNHHIAYMVVEKERVDELRALLKPNRGQYYEEI